MATRKAQVPYSWHANQHGSWMIFHDRALRALHMAFRVQREEGKETYMLIIRHGEKFTRRNHGYPEQSIARKYCEDYLAEELKQQEERVYRDTLSEEDQLDAEEWIAGAIFDASSGEVNEGECQELGQEILMEILSRFRPDLVSQGDTHDTPQ